MMTMTKVHGCIDSSDGFSILENIMAVRSALQRRFTMHYLTAFGYIWLWHSEPIPGQARGSRIGAD